MQRLVNNTIRIWQENEEVRSIPAQGRSMYPLIREGDNLRIKFCKPQAVRVGDIIALRRGESTIVHRLIKKTDAGFLEKGDLQLRAQPVETERIIGRLIWHGAAGCGVNNLLAFLGRIIHRLSAVKFFAKPLLLIPFIINAGTRVIIKLR